jgi:8-oxo-dGTP pyrophosphatase MutT (NUDIX family)
MTSIRTVPKVVTYIIAADRLLVFTHPHHPEVGVQVPAGSIEPGERPEAAALREAREETGLTGFGEPVHLGDALYDMSAHGRAELHQRHFYRLSLERAECEQWQHLETSGGRSAPEVFALYWVPLAAIPELAVGLGAFVHRLLQVGRHGNAPSHSHRP